MENEKLLEIMLKQFERMGTKFEAIHKRFDAQDEHLLRIDNAIENEIRPNFKLLADGHMALNEKMDRVEGKVETIEGDIEDIKNTVSVLKAISVKHQ